MQLKAISFILFNVVLYTSSIAQSPILEKYVQEALRQNLTIYSATLSKEKQLSRIEQAQRLWGPTVDFNGTYLLATGGRQISFPLGDLFNPVNDAINELSGTDQFPTNLENAQFQLTPNNFIDFQVNAALPLVNSSIRYNQKIQEALLKLEDLNIELARVQIREQVKGAYFNYLKSLEGLRILDNSKVLLEEVLDFNKKLVQFDKATDEIIYDVEFQIEQLNSQSAQLIEQNTAAKALFNLLLNRELTVDIEVDTNLIGNLKQGLPALQELQQSALSNRLEFQQLLVARTTNDLNSQRIAKEAQPTLGLQAGIGIQTENFDFDVGGPLYTIGLGMSISLFDNGLRKRRREEITVDNQILTNNRDQLLQQVKIEVIQVYYALKSLQSQMLSETAAETSAQNSYVRTKIRYENDKALLIELLQVQNRLTTSQLSKALTKYDYLIKLAELERIINQDI